MESHARTLVRVLVWRVMGVALGVLVTWWFTRDAALGLEVGVVYNGVRLVTHWGYEVAWKRWVRWGA